MKILISNLISITLIVLERVWSNYL